MNFDSSCKYIMRARLMAMNNRYDKAFDMMLVAFKRIPSLIPIYEREFCTVLDHLNSMLANEDTEKINQITHVFNNFRKAIQIYPTNPELLNDIGKYLYRYGFFTQALDQFEEVLQVCPIYADAEKNVNSLKNMLVERWHYRMLNDNLRNESYKKAIHLVVTQEDKVLDVGTGTGLLGIYATEAGANKVIGCDGSKVMCGIAENVVINNKINKMTIINEMSTDLTPDGLSGTCSKLVTEMFDAGLFGEHVLQMLSHAWSTLLSTDAVVVPSKAEFFVMGAQCDHLSKNYKLGPEAKALLNIPSLNVHICLQNETYDSEDVHHIKDIKYLTKPESVLKINFNNLKDIMRNLEMTDSYEVEFVAKENGQMNIVIGWFNLYLTNSITITTDPRAPDRANAWQQAVFFDDIPKTVQENEHINFEFLMNAGQLTMIHSSDNPITRVSEEVIRFLNDNEYMKMIKDCMLVACERLTQINKISEINVVDLCPFPLFGLLMLKHGAKSLTCYASNEHDRDFLMKVLLRNEIAHSKVSTVLHGDWSIEEFKEDCYHAIFNHSLDLCGDVDLTRERVKQDLIYDKLVHGGLFFPQQLKLVVQLVSSHWLDLNNKLYDRNVDNYFMGAQLNRYKVTQNFDIDFSMLKYVPISEPIVLSDFDDFDTNQIEKLVKVIRDGYANAILCWFSIGLVEQTLEISTNRPNSFMNGMLFLTYSKEQLIAGNSVKIIQHKDSDGQFKVVMKTV